MAKQAIEVLIERFAGREAPAVVKRQFKARNGLMHGRSADSVEATCKMSLPELVDELGILAWYAIGSTVPQISRPLHFGYRGGQFANMELMAAANLTFEHTSAGPHPEERELPNAEVELVARFGSSDGDVDGNQ